MICWMSDKTNEILDSHGMSVIGFDLDRDAEDAWCFLEMNGNSMGICLGNVKGLGYDLIERRFAAAMLQFAISAAEDGDNEGYDVVDELLLAITRKDR